MALIFALSEIQRPPGPLFPGSDKLVHLGLYAILGALLVRALAHATLARVTPGILIVSVAVSIGYGIADEIHQGYVGREQDAADVAADAAGSALAAGAIRAWVILARRAGPIGPQSQDQPDQ
jgi:VanZ family protein